MNTVLHVALLFGGVSSEHDVSCVSAQNFMNRLEEKPDRYVVLPIYISRQGEWFLYEGDRHELAKAPSGQYARRIAVVPGGRGNALRLLSENGQSVLYTDVVIPVLHGLNGEDGTVQGLLEMARLPYVGCGVLASAVSMDKVYTKKVVDPLGIRQAAYLDLTREEIISDVDGLVRRVEEAFRYPVFVKPSRAGSSVGVTKAHDAAELTDGLVSAAREDRRVLVEEFIRGREVECAVMGACQKGKGYEIGEVLAAAEFYDFEAKYANAQSRTVVPAEISAKSRQELIDAAEAIYRAVDGEGLARVDFFLEEGTDDVVFNEINTFPGFTPISMWPMLMECGGVDPQTQIEELIRIAMERNPLYGS